MGPGLRNTRPRPGYGLRPVATLVLALVVAGCAGPFLFTREAAVAQAATPSPSASSSASPVVPPAILRTYVFSDVTGGKAFYFDFLGSIGIFSGETGPGGPVRPDAVLTRAEFAAIVVRLLGAERTAASMAAQEASFTDAGDIPAWARGVVNYCAAQNILRGVPGSDGRLYLRPASPVLGVEALAMLVRALDNETALAGYWPSNYMVRAYETGLLSVVGAPGDWRSIEPLGEVTRAQMALLTYNAFFSGRGYAPSAQGGTGSFARLSLASGRTGTGQVVAIDAAARLLRLSARDLRLAGTVTVIGASSFDELLGRTVFYAKAPGGDVAYVRLQGEASFVEGEIDSARGSSVAAGLTLTLTDGAVLTVRPSAVLRMNGVFRAPGEATPSELLAGAALWAVVEEGEVTYLDVQVLDLREAILLRWDLTPPAASGADEAASDDAGTTGTAGTAGTGGTIGTVTVRDATGLTLVLEVTGQTEILAGGGRLALRDLREFSVVSAATSGAAGRRALRLVVVSESVVRTLLDTVVTYSGMGQVSTGLVIPSPGSEPETVDVDQNRVTRPAEGWTTGRDYRLAFDSRGRVIYVGPPGPSSGHAALVKVERVLDGPGGGLPKTVTVDHRGQAYTFNLAEGSSVPAGVLTSLRPGAVGRLTVGPDRQIVSFSPVPLSGESYEVYSVSETAVSIGRAGRWWNVPAGELVIYVYSPETPGGLGTFISWRALRPGDIVQVDDPSAPSYMVVYYTLPGP